MGADEPTRPRGTAHEPGTLRPGTVLGRYILVRPLGQGGSAEVHAAHDQRLQREVALKVLHRPAPDLHHSTPAAARGWELLLHEAQALARLSHPNVVTVHDVVVEDQRVLLSMELIDGVDLETWLTTAAAQPRAERLRVLAEAGAGLHAAHAAGLVHRDFKPANVLVDRDGPARVVDFGLAAWGRGAVSLPDAAGPGQGEVTATAYGTPAFMAPEQHRGEEGDARVDVFAFCVTAWRVLFGRAPFLGADVHALAQAKAHGPPAPPSTAGVPRALARTIARGLHPDPAQRPASLDVLLDALASARRPPRLWIAGVAVVIVAGAAVAGAASTLDRQPLTFADPCVDAGAAGTVAWNAEHRATIEAAFDGIDEGWAPYARNIAVRELGTYAKGWEAMAERACRIRMGGDEAASVVAARSECLRERVDALGEVVRSLHELDEDTARRSAEAIRGLPSVLVCGDRIAMRRRAPLPEDPRTVAQIRQHRTSIAAVRGLLRKGNLPAALRLARKTAAEADALGVPAVQAETQYWLGVMLRRTGDEEAAEEAMHAAVAAAQTARHDVVEADAWIDLVHLVGRRRRYEEALRYARFAEAALARIGSPPQTVARLLASRGTVLVATGRTEEGLAEYQAARAIDVELYGEGDQAGLATVQHIGAAQTRLRRYAEAEKTFAQGLAYATEAVGTQHPTTARFAMSYGGILAQLRRYDEARPHFEAGLATRQAVLSRDDPELAAAHRAFAVFESNQGRYAQADEHLAAAVTVLDRREPPDADELVSTLVERCSTRYRLGEIDEAWDHCLRARTVAEAQPRPEPVGHFTSVNRLAIIAKRRGEPESAHALRVQAITIGEQAWGPSNARLADPLLGAASIDIEQGRAEAAVPRLRRAAELRRADGTAHGQLPYNHLLLARALAEREPAQAQTHAQQAWRLAEEGGNADVRTLTAAWLRERALPLPQ